MHVVDDNGIRLVDPTRYIAFGFRAIQAKSSDYKETL